MRSGHIKVKKGTHHLFYLAIPHHTSESVLILISWHEIAVVATTIVIWWGLFTDLGKAVVRTLPALCPKAFPPTVTSTVCM